MIGVMIRLLSDFVEKNFGTDALGTALNRAGLPADHKFRLDVNYPDSQWKALFDAAVEFSGLPADQAELAFAHYCGEDLALRFPGFLKGATSAREVIKRQPAIHNFIAASLRDPEAKQAVSDKFRLEEVDSETIMHYVSPNKQCLLYKGLAQWMADHFHEKIEITEPRCAKLGDTECEIHIKYLDEKSG